MAKALILPLAALLCAAGAGSAAADPANNIQTMFAGLSQCLNATPLRLAAGTDITVQFMVNRRGGLIGKPRLTHAKWGGDDNDRKASAESIATGFDHCMPLSISDALGAAIAGQLLAFRLQGKPPDAKT